MPAGSKLMIFLGGNLFKYHFFKTLSLCLLTFLFFNYNPAQEKGALRGIVVDSTNGEILPFCNVVIENSKLAVTSNGRGLFVFPSLKSGRKYTVLATYMGYENKKLIAEVFADSVVDIKFQMVPKSIELQVVEKVGRRIAEKNDIDLGLHRLTLRELAQVPKGVESDIFRALQYLPGVKTTGDVSAKFNVRGGAFDQNLILVDGITYYNPYHALGLFSSIDEDILNVIEFYKSGFGAEFGGRLSSVLKMETKDGNNTRFSGKATLSYLTAKVFVEGPLPVGSFFISARKSHSTEILKKFLNDKNAPVKFYDLTGKLTFQVPKLWKNVKFSLLGIVSGDELFHNDPTKEDYRWNSKLFGFRWHQLGEGDPVFYEIGLSHSRYGADVISNNSGLKNQNNTVDESKIDAVVNYIYPNKNELMVGIDIKDVSYHHQISAGTNEALINGKGTSIAFYSKFRFMQFENLGIDAGLRVNLTRLAIGTAGQKYIEPRFNLSWRMADNLVYKFSYGEYNQEFVTVFDENEILNIYEIWVIVPHYLQTARAYCLNTGFEYELTKDISLEIEGFYKDINNFVVLNPNSYSAFDRDLKSAQGEAYGVDFALEYNGEELSASTSFSYGYIYHKIDQKKFRPKFDNKYSFNTTISYNLGSGWKAGAVWTYSSGRPFTQMIGYYDRLNPENFNSDLGGDLFEPYQMFGEMNSSTLPDYHRLDLMISKKLRIWNTNLSFDFNIINVYNRANLFYYKRKTGERVNMLPFLPSVNLKVEL